MTLCFLCPMSWVFNLEFLSIPLNDSLEIALIIHILILCDDDVNREVVSILVTEVYILTLSYECYDTLQILIAKHC